MLKPFGRTALPVLLASRLMVGAVVAVVISAIDMALGEVSCGGGSLNEWAWKRAEYVGSGGVRSGRACE